MLLVLLASVLWAVRIRYTFAQGLLNPIYDKVIESKIYRGVKISYKEPKLCETTPNVKSFSGYVSMPKGILTAFNVTNDYPVNLFFWYFESRKDSANAPLAIWLNGAGQAGGSAMKPLFHGTGPCYVTPDSKSTSLNPWSWNKEANVLYLDQPVQTGFSFDELKTTTRGTTASQNAFNTAHTSDTAAKTLWVFMQAFLQEIPEIKRRNNAVGLWGTGYGGRWAPSFGAYFLRRSVAKVANEIPIKVETVGIVNGFIDMAIQQPTLPLFAFNNTYGIHAIEEMDYRSLMRKYNSETGCGPALAACRASAPSSTDGSSQINDNASNICGHAANVCSAVAGGYSLWSSRSTADVTTKLPSSFPPPYFIGYLNSQAVQKALGVPRNFTADNINVESAFNSYDETLGGHLEDIGYMLDQGVNVALVYGDRDYLNNWLGGEAISTSVKFKDTAAFKAAGYQNVQTNASYIGGQTRQVGRFSFTRVYDAGAEAHAYQPETLYKIFLRAMSSRDVASGAVTATSSSYKTTGASSTWAYKNRVPCPVKSTCYVLEPRTCTTLQKSAYEGGYGIITDYVLTGYKANVPDYLDPPYARNPPKTPGC